MNKTKYNIIAAVRSDEEFEYALQSNVLMIFDLSPDISKLTQRAGTAHINNKKIFIHIDLAAGIGKDKSGMLYAKNAGIDGIISTRVSMVKAAREIGLFSVQRFFIVDSHSVDTSIEALKSSKPDMIEIMPGIIPKVVKMMTKKTNIPIIAGGLISNITEIENTLDSGAYAISTGNTELWQVV